MLGLKKMVPVLGGLCLLVSALVTNPGIAQEDLSELSIEDLMDIPVFAASKKVQLVSEAPAFVTIVTSNEIGLFGDQTIYEILDRVAGFYYTEDRAYSYLGTRGFSRPGDYNSRFLILVNGVRINNSVDDSSGSSRDFVMNPEVIERIEIVRGPGSSLYGTSAFFAVINVITKSAADIDGLDLLAGTGSNGDSRESFTFGHRMDNGLKIVANGSAFKNDGRSFYFEEFDDPTTNNGLTDPESDSEEETKFYLNLSKGPAVLQAGYSSRTKHDPTGAWDTQFNDPRNLVKDDILFVDLNISKEFSFGWLSNGRVGLNSYKFDGEYLYDYAEEGDPPYLTINKDETRVFTWLGELNFSTEKYKNQMLTLGLEARMNTQQLQYNYDIEFPDEPYVDDDRESLVLGLFGQDEIRLTSNVLLNLGLRYDHYETFGGSVNPRVALVATPWNDTTIKFLYGKAFRAPNSYEMYYSDGYLLGNPELQPEENHSFEFLAEKRINQNFQVTAAVYHYTADNLINQEEDPDTGFLQFKNLGNVSAGGLDLVVDGRTASGISCRASYSYARARDEETDLRLTNSPENMVKLTVMVPVLKDKLTSGLTVRHMSSRLKFAGEPLGSQTLTDLTVQAQVPGTALQVNAGAYNLFDEEYAFPVGDEHRQSSIVGQGRNWRATLKFHW